MTDAALTDGPSRRFTLRPIGLLRTPFATRADCPRNGRQPDPAPQCRAEVFPEFVEGLADLDGFSHLILLYWLDEIREPSLTMTPPFDGRPRGVFATRAPVRPNPIALSVVAFDGFAAPGVLLGALPRLHRRHAADRHQTLSAEHRRRAGGHDGLARAACHAAPSRGRAFRLTPAPGLRDMPGPRKRSPRKRSGLDGASGPH